MDGWYLEDRSSGSSSSTAGSLSSLLDAYGVSFGSTDNSSCNSVMAYKEEQQQQQLSQVYMDMDHLFSEEFVPPSELAMPIPTEQWQPSSSSCSRQSYSVGSSDSSSVLTNGQFFPTPTDDDMAIASAILAIFSTPTSNRPLQRTGQGAEKFRSGFEPYDPAREAPAYEPKTNACGQKMIKSSLSILRRIDLMRDHGAAKDALPSGSQLHHALSERKRREKLNGSFHALRMLLPPGSKKDNASVLHKTKEYLKILKTQISDLEAKNKALEEHILPIDDMEEGILDSMSTERVHVQVSETVKEVIGLQIAVAFECDLVELALCVLECLKRMSVKRLVSMDAKYCLWRSCQVTVINVKLDIKDSDWDEETFKEAVTRAVAVVVATTVKEIHDNSHPCVVGNARDGDIP